MALPILAGLGALARWLLPRLAVPVADAVVSDDKPKGAPVTYPSNTTRKKVLPPANRRIIWDEKNKRWIYPLLPQPRPGE